MVHGALGVRETIYYYYLKRGGDVLISNNVNISHLFTRNNDIKRYSFCAVERYRFCAVRYNTVQILCSSKVQILRSSRL